MSKILVIAEKPSVGRDIARVLGCTKKGEGYLFGEEYIVSWAVGHLTTLCEPEDYDENLKKWNFSVLPIIPEEMKLKAIPATRQQLKVLNSLMNSKDVESIICATDSGREGELIFRYIYNIVKCKKPFKRLWISSMTDIAIKEGFANLKDGAEFDDLYKSAKCRSEADWLVGINATRAYTLKYNALLSIGRVQTPTLAIIVQRQKEIDAFVPSEYFEVESDYKDFKGTWIDDKENTKIDSKEKADEIAKKVKGREGVIIKNEKENKSTPPPLLYDLTELQRDCNKKFGFSAKKTLSIVQELYETKKMVTYPRTDSRYLSSDMTGKIKNVLKRLKANEIYGKFAAPILEKEKLPINKRIIDDSKVTDHHAIIPTDVNINLSRLSEDEKKVFNLIAIRFISVFYPHYLYSTTKIIVECEKERFLSKGMEIISLGWQEIYNALDKSKEKGVKKEKEDTQILPSLKSGDTLTIINTLVKKKKTQAPKPYTEAGLLSAMENAGRFIEDEELKEQLKGSGLGTPATRAAIIERLISVGYIVRKGKSLIPTEKGIKLIEIVPFELKSPQTTGKWERGLNKVAEGKMQTDRFMGSIKRYVYYLIEESKKVNRNVVFKSRS